MVAVIVLIGFRDLLPRVKDGANLQFNSMADGIMGVPPPCFFPVGEELRIPDYDIWPGTDDPFSGSEWDQGAPCRALQSSWWRSENSNYWFSCPSDHPFMVGRYHYGDESGGTNYYCCQSNPQMRIRSRAWYGVGNENADSYSRYGYTGGGNLNGYDECPPERPFLSGRAHEGDESGYTWHLCMSVENDDWPSAEPDQFDCRWIQNVQENHDAGRLCHAYSGSWGWAAKAGWTRRRSFMTGREHKGDESDWTRVKCCPAYALGEPDEDCVVNDPRNVAVDGGWCPWGACMVDEAGNLRPADCSEAGNQMRSCFCPSPANGGDECTGVDTQACIGECFPLDGGWCEWGPCNVNCGPGTQTRLCECPIPDNGGAACVGIDTQACDMCAASVDGAWCPWTACLWNAAEHKFVTTRACNCPAPANGGAPCEGEEIQDCTGPWYPPRIDGGWCDWGECSQLCGGGTQTRECDCPAPQNRGNDCVGSSTQACNTQACTGEPINGEWCDWSACSVLCGGDGTKTRTCTCPAPANGGQPCLGTDSETCNNGCCPVDGGWSIGAWSAWAPDPCTEGETQVRSRTVSCTNPTPDCMGDPCPAPAPDSSESRECPAPTPG